MDKALVMKSENKQMRKEKDRWEMQRRKGKADANEKGYVAGI